LLPFPRNGHRPRKSGKPKIKATRNLQKGTHWRTGAASRRNGGALGKRLNGALAKAVQKKGAKKQRNGAKKQKNGANKQSA